MYRHLISRLFHEANNKIFYFKTSPASQCHYTQRLVNKSRYLHSDPICAIESCPETCPPSNRCFTRSSPLLGYITLSQYINMYYFFFLLMLYSTRSKPVLPVAYQTIIIISLVSYRKDFLIIHYHCNYCTCT